MARWSQAELQQFEGATVDDLLAPVVDLLFVGINPGLWTAAANAHFARRGNRFWPALAAAGILPRVVDASNGLDADDLAMVAEARIGISNVVPVATARADQLSVAQLRDGGQALLTLVRLLRPAVVAVLGVTAFRQAFGNRSVAVGPLAHADSPTPELDVSWFVLPNPSGLNAHETVASLAVKYRAAAEAAGVVEPGVWPTGGG